MLEEINWKNSVKNDCKLIKILSRHFAGGSEENPVTTNTADFPTKILTENLLGTSLKN
jgi:hypothetical protein